MHILILPSTFFLSKKRPNAGIFQADLADLLVKHEHEVGVIALKPLFSFDQLWVSFKQMVKSIIQWNESTYWVLNFFDQLWIFINSVLKIRKAYSVEYKNDHYRIIRNNRSYGFIREKEDLSKSAFWIRTAERFLDNYIQQYGKPDVIHAHNFIYAGIVAKAISKKYDVPYLVTEHSSAHMNQAFDDEFLGVLKNVIHHTNHISAVSPIFIEQLKEKYDLHDREIVWLPNVIDHLFEKVPLKEKRKSHSKFTFLHIANLKPIKGQLLLIKAFANAFKEDEEVQLKIGGDGFLLNELKKEIELQQQQSKIKLLGYLNRKQILKEMDESDAFVLSSFYETFGVVLIESLSRGKPIVATNCGGPKCIVDSNNGILVEKDSVSSLAMGLIEMRNTISKFSATSIRENVIKRYGAEPYYKRIFALYKNITSKQE